MIDRKEQAHSSKIFILKGKEQTEFLKCHYYFKKNQYVASQEQSHSKIKLFICLVLNNGLPAPRKKTISTEASENKSRNHLGSFL